MSILPKPTPASAPRTADANKIAIFYAFLLTVFVVAQLFTFESFLELLRAFDLPMTDEQAYGFTASLIAAELFALPFLLRMPLSRAFRWVSMGLGWLVALSWVGLTLWLVLTQPDVETVGFLGTAVDIIPGWWAVCISVGLGILASWASWGLWPGKRKKIVAN